MELTAKIMSGFEGSMRKYMAESLSHSRHRINVHSFSSMCLLSLDLQIVFMPSFTKLFKFDFIDNFIFMIINIEGVLAL